MIIFWPVKYIYGKDLCFKVFMKLNNIMNVLIIDILYQLKFQLLTKTSIRNFKMFQLW